MKVRLFGCYRFRRIAAELSDRELTDREMKFLESHRRVCQSCVRTELEAASALDALRSITLDAMPDPMFEERVMRRLRVSSSRNQLRTWVPAFAGASIACLTIIAALQIVSIRPSVSGFNAGGSGAMDFRSRGDVPLLLVDQHLTPFKLGRDQ